MKKIAVFGSTGSIGTQALDFIGANSSTFKADVLIAHSNLDLLLEQAQIYKPSAIGLLSEDRFDKEKLSRLSGIKTAVGKDAYELCFDADMVLFSTVGTDALQALMAFVKRGMKIALANKECLVSAGNIITEEAKKSGAEIIPVDSEQCAVWLCVRAGGEVIKIVLTASGGRYYGYSEAELKKITPSEAMVHPNWKMGKKISIDSATMMNKALELIEARWLFDTVNVDYVIHPESIIHSMVVTSDGAVFAQLSEPDMRLPISVALSYPERTPCGIKNFEFDKRLTFLPKREDVFYAPTLGKFCIEKGGASGVILDASNEAAVKLYVEGRITFPDISKIVKKTLYNSDFTNDFTIEEIIELHSEIKNKVYKDNL